MTLRWTRLMALPLAALTLGAVYTAGCSDADAPAAAAADSGTGTSDGAPPTTDPDASAGTDGALKPGELKPGEVSGVDVKADVLKFDLAFAEAICKKLDSCCLGDYRAAALTQFFEQSSPYTLKDPPDAATCVDTIRKQFDAFYGDIWAPAVAKKQLAYNAVRAAKCVSDLNALSCGPDIGTYMLSEPCFYNRRNEVFRKLGQVGEACEGLTDKTLHGTCDAESGFCDGPSSAVAKRTCVAWSKPDEPCGANPTYKFCNQAKGSYCSGIGPGSVCTPNGGIGKEGDDCGATTASEVTCGAGLYCDGARGGSDTCVKKKAAGAVCSGSYECLDGVTGSCAREADSTTRCGSKTFCDGKTTPFPAPDGGN